MIYAGDLNASFTTTPFFQGTSATTTTLTGSSSYTLGLYEPLGPDQVGFHAELDADGKVVLAKVNPRCPFCAYPNFPFRRKRKPEKQETVGSMYSDLTLEPSGDPKSPYGHYQCWCVYCHEAFTLVLYPPK